MKHLPRLLWLTMVLAASPGLLLAQHGNRTENRALLGVVTVPAQKAVQVVHVLPKSPAAKAGLKPGDLLLSINKTKLQKPAHVDTALKSIEPGSPIQLVMKRKGKKGSAAIKVIDRKAYKGDFLRRPSRGKTGIPAKPWFAYAWSGVPKGVRPPTLESCRGQVIVIHTFQSW